MCSCWFGGPLLGVLPGSRKGDGGLLRLLWEYAPGWGGAQEDPRRLPTLGLTGDLLFLGGEEGSSLEE